MSPFMDPLIAQHFPEGHLNEPQDRVRVCVRAL